MNRKSEGVINDTINNSINNINNLIDNSGARSLVNKVDDWFGTSLSDYLPGGNKNTLISPGGNFLIKTDKAILTAIDGQTIGQGIDNQFTKITAQFIYADNPDIMSGNGIMGALGEAGNILGQAGKIAGKFM